jgi:hypothetical protein
MVVFIITVPPEVPVRSDSSGALYLTNRSKAN